LQAVTKALYHLLSYPEYLEPLRQDVETAIAEEGWTKAGIDKMHKIDSFLRESQRVDGAGEGPLNPLAVSQVLVMRCFLLPVSIARIALRPFTFSNGVTVPAGTLIAVPTGAVYADEEVYPNPEKFDGFRFAKLRERGGPVAGYQAVSTSWDHLSFGLGRHAW